MPVFLPKEYPSGMLLLYHPFQTGKRQLRPYWRSNRQIKWLREFASGLIHLYIYLKKLFVEQLLQAWGKQRWIWSISETPEIHVYLNAFERKLGASKFKTFKCLKSRNNLHFSIKMELNSNVKFVCNVCTACFRGLPWAGGGLRWYSRALRAEALKEAGYT